MDLSASQMEETWSFARRLSNWSEDMLFGDGGEVDGGGVATGRPRCAPAINHFCGNPHLKILD